MRARHHMSRLEIPWAWGSADWCPLLPVCLFPISPTAITMLRYVMRAVIASLYHSPIIRLSVQRTFPGVTKFNKPDMIRGLIVILAYWTKLCGTSGIVLVECHGVTATSAKGGNIRSRRHWRARSFSGGCRTNLVLRGRCRLRGQVGKNTHNRKIH